MITSLTKAFKERDAKVKIFVVEENVDRDDESKTLLKNYYENPPKYALSFQKWILKDKFSQFLEIQNKVEKEEFQSIIIFDRSLNADHLVFCKLQHELGNILKMEYEEYLNFLKNIQTEFENIIKIMNYSIYTIYLDTSVLNCLLRIEKRLREGEVGKISENYLQYLNDGYLKLYKNSNEALYIDGNEDILKVVKSVDILVHNYLI
jgi:deoxyadenosine/deoxycytidine kinase